MLNPISIDVLMVSTRNVPMLLLNSELSCSKCLPILLHCSEALVFSAYDVSMLNRLHVLFRAFAKIFKTYDRAIIETVRNVYHVSDVSIILKGRHDNFCRKYYAKPFAFSYCIESIAHM